MKKDKLTNFVGAVPDVPSLPVVATRILHIIADGNSSLEDLKKVISLDQAFSLRLLKVANSPYYRASNTVSDISDAITRIGFTTVQALVFAISLRDLRRSSNKTDVALWEHSLAASVASGLIARDLGVIPSGEAFVYGLLHDIGKVVINLSMKKEFAEVIRIVQEEHISFPEAENRILGFDHGDMGQYVAKQWRLPSDMVLAIANHHETDILSGGESAELKRKTLIVKAADALCASMGIGLSGGMTLSAEEWQYVKLGSPKRREALSAIIADEYLNYHSFVTGQPVQGA